jgi:hypothetical protein
MSPELSIVVVAYDMDRELPRTLSTLDPRSQRGIRSDAYEVVVVDNGSPNGLPDAALASFSGLLRTARIDDAGPSPAHAANVGIELATAPYIGLIVDGARMASPGLLARAVLARSLANRPVVATLAWHLGEQRHIDAGGAGFDRTAEDALLAGVPWERDGYALFAVSTLAGSSGRGWFGPLGESSALFMPSALWSELGGLDETFVLPGGGLVNHDLFRRALELHDTQLVVLLGEGTFHQQHGGAATSGALSWDQMQADYAAKRGEPYKPPRQRPLYLGEVPGPVLPHVVESARLATERAARARRRADAGDKGTMTDG